MDAKCIELRYVEGRFGRITEAEKEQCVREGWVIQRRSRSMSGSHDAIFPSRLLLVMDIDGVRRKVRVDKFFKARIGRLSERRRNAISRTMPANVSVTSKYGRSGSFLAVSMGDLVRWAERAEDILGPKRRSR